MVSTSVLAAVPKDIEAERQVLGAILIEPKRIEDVPELREHHFFDDANRCIYGTLQRMKDAGIPLTLSLLVAELRKCGKLDFVGGPAYLAQCAQENQSTHHVAWFANVVRETWAQRKIGKWTERVYAKHDARPPAESIADLREMIDLVESDVESVGFRDMAEVCDSIDRDLTNGGAPIVSTGIPKLDKVTTGGLHACQITLLGANTSVGKSALAIQISEHAARQGKSVLYVSLEMCAEEIIQMRMIPRYRARHPNASDDEIRRSIRKLPILWLDEKQCSKVTVDRIYGVARLVAARRGLDLIVVDHIGLIHESIKNPYDRTTEVMRNLRPMPKVFNVPVLALCQLNRESRYKKEAGDESMERPTLDRLRDSGSLEQDAVNVWLFHREHKESESAELIIAKQRNGPIGIIKMQYNLDSQTLEQA